MRAAALTPASVPVPAPLAAPPELQPLGRGAPLGLRWRTMAQVGLRMMFHDKLKMLGTLIGAVFAVVLSNQQAGTFMGLIYKNIMFVDKTQADLWITPPATEQFQAGRAISTAALMQARGAPGVAWAEPLLVGGATVALPGGGSEPVTLIGTRLPRLAGGPWNLVAGSTASLGRADTMIFEDSERDKLGGLNLGSVREVSGHRTRVGGFAWGLLPFGPSYAFADFDYAQLLLHTATDQTSFVLVGVQPGADVAAVAAELQRRAPETKVMTRAAYRRSIITYLLTKSPIGITFGTSTLFGLIVGFVIVALSMFSAVVDNLREFGTLKAIGATTWDLAKLLLVQSVAYALLGTLIGLAVVTRIAEGIRSPKLAVILPPELLVGTTVLMVLLCITASSLALLRIRNIEPAMVFR
jgi:putative ABC transport system permease protein